MSTWISKGAGLLLITLSACVPVDGAGLRPGQTRAGPVLNGALRIAAPAGYCIDRAASREAADTAVVLMGRCFETAATAPALITVTVGRTASATSIAAGSPALAAYFTSAQGHAALSRDGRATSVRLLGAWSTKTAFILHVDDRLAGRYWRAILIARDRVLTVTVTALGSDLPPAQGRRLLDQTILAVLRANAAN